MTDVLMGVVRSRTRITPEGEFQEYYEVEFMIGDAKYKLEMSPKDFTAEKAEKAVALKAKELLAIQGKKVTL